MEDEVNIWDRFGSPCGGYNSAVDEQIYRAAKLIVDARKNEKTLFVDELSGELDISEPHAELIQYLLASVRYEDRPRLKDSPFDYGTSPRGLFVGDMECAERFLEEFSKHMRQWRS